MFRRIALTVILVLACTCSCCAEFVPEQPIMPVSELKAGMTGYVLTVLKGHDPEKLPMKVVSIIPQKPGGELSDEILIRLSRHKLAQGMSGSPVYVQGKLIGAVRSGWEMSDQSLACVAPIESMCRIFAEPQRTQERGVSLSVATISGLNVSTPSVQDLSRRLGVTFTQGLTRGTNPLTLSSERLKPGDSVCALLVWGDVEVGSVGTVTATARDGRFLAFGHPFSKSGRASYPAAKTYIHDIVNSYSFPFKLATAEAITGTFTQDREAGIGGKFGVYPPSIQGELVFRDMDRETEKKYSFRVIADEFMSREILGKVFAALSEEAWGRKGQGTMSVNLRIDGRAVPKGWTRKDIFFSDDNILTKAFEQSQEIISAYLTQPFSETLPAGFTLTVEATQNPRTLKIIDVTAPESAQPGESVEVSVTLKGWRTNAITRKFSMTIPDDAEEGVCELIVRSGSVDPSSQTAIEEGWKSIDSAERMLAEVKALDANNELILELNIDRLGPELDRVLRGGKREGPDLLPEQQEYLSETKARRIKEGSLKILSSDYVIQGHMKRLIHVEK